MFSLRFIRGLTIHGFREAKIKSDATAFCPIPEVGASGTYKDLRQIPKPKDCPTNGTSWIVEQPPCGYKNGGGNFVVMYSELKSQAERKSAIAAHAKDGINTPCLSNYWVFTATNSKYGYICADAFGNPTPVATNIARLP